ncbi:hypothetical protein FRC09_013069 [Ceratobasidium sp. 395]|nr:hypothetical protein FRC09_013069 [Ceratobasidium sp. 395]
MDHRNVLRGLSSFDRAAGDIQLFVAFIQTVQLDDNVDDFAVVVSEYDTVTVILANPNITDPNQWWAPDWVPKGLRVIRTVPGECEPAVLPVNTELRTNSSLPLFTYTLLSTFDQHGLAQAPYKANPLNSCHVAYMSILMETKALTLDITARVWCEVASNVTRSRQFEARFKTTQDSRFRDDSFYEYMVQRGYTGYTSEEAGPISQLGPPKDTILNVLGVIDGLSSDLTQLLRMQWITRFASDTLRKGIPEIGYVFWEDPSGTPHSTSALSIGALDASAGHYLLSQNISYFLDMNITVANLFVAIRDAIHLDVGNITPANIYVNRSMFNNLIVSNNYYTDVASRIPLNHPEDHFNAPSWGWGYAPGPNASWAQAFASTTQPVNNITLPISIPLPTPPSVIDIMYLCPQYQLKSWGSLFMALFTGTFTTYASLYGLFAWFGPMLDRKQNGPQPLELLVDQRNREAQLEEYHPLGMDPRAGKSVLDIEISAREHLLADGLKS